MRSINLEISFAAAAGLVTLGGCTRETPKASPTATADSRDSGALHAKTQTTAPSDANPWEGCKKESRPEALAVMCSRQRVVILAKLPKLTDRIFDVNAQKFFAQIPTVGAPPVTTTVKLADGVIARSSEGSARTPPAEDGSTSDIAVMMVGIPDRDGSGLLISCVGKDAASCRADVEEMYARPPR